MAFTLPTCVLMIRPTYFAYNPETSLSNSFQHELPELDPIIIRQMALDEFNNFVSLLEAWDVEVMVFEDTAVPHKPDAVFPNNWFSTHLNGWLITYPMLDPKRRAEVRDDIILTLKNRFGYVHRNELKKLEEENKFLEGTGSLVLDRHRRVAYAALSPRTNADALDAWAKLTGFKCIAFNALGPKGEPIYHTNVMMCVGDNFALLGLDCIAEADKDLVVQSLLQAGKRIIPLSKSQIYEHFAGNMLALCNRQGERLLVMSAAAKRSLSNEQLRIITQELALEILAAPLSIIEAVGGGSARCMMAEIVQPQ